MRVLVTGARGFVGRNLCCALKNIRDGKDRRERFAGLLPLEVMEFDVDSTPGELEDFCSRADFVFNLAGVNRPKEQSEFMEGNFGFASTLLDTLERHGNRCPVMLSSSAQASLSGRFEGSVYGESKLAGEGLFREYSERTGAPVLIYRFPNLYGKWCRPRYNSAVATFCDAIANGRPYTVNDPSVELELLYIDDLVDEMLGALLGEEHRCGYEGLERVEGDGFCYVPETDVKTLGEIVYLLDGFRDSRETLAVPDLSDGSFSKKLWSTFLSYYEPGHFAYSLKPNTDDRGSLYGYRLGTSQLLFWLMTVLWLPLINLLMSGGMAQDKAYFTAAIIFTVPGLLFAVLLYRNSREVVEPQKSTKLPAKDLWHFVIQNGPLLMVMFGQFVCGIYMYGRSGVMMYYFTYYAGNTNLFTIYNLIAIGCGIAGPFTAPILMEKCGNKGRIVALGAIGSGALFVAMNFINAGTNPLLFYIFAGVSGYFNGLIMAAVYACMLDTIEVGQYKTGIRASAFAVSLCHFANKLGMTISTAGVGAVLAALGFAANQTQNGDVLFWINGFFTWVPGVIGIVVGVVFLFYKLNRERYYEILAKLKEKAE